VGQVTHDGTHAGSDARRAQNGRGDLLLPLGASAKLKRCGNARRPDGAQAGVFGDPIDPKPRERLQAAHRIEQSIGHARGPIAKEKGQQLGVAERGRTLVNDAIPQVFARQGRLLSSES
jgi:hypothetical protein